MKSKLLIKLFLVLFLFSVSAFAQKKCLYIVASTSLSTQDQIINDKLVEWGYEVTPQAPSDLKYLFPEDYANYDFAFISESIGSGDLSASATSPSGGTFYSIPLPTASLEGWLVKPGAMDWQTVRNVNNFAPELIKIVDNTGSVLAAGFSEGSTVTLCGSDGLLVGSVPQIPIIPIATLSSNDSMQVIYGIEAGTINAVGDTILNRVAVIGINAVSYTSLTEDAFKFIKAGINWVSGSATGVEKNPSLPQNFELKQNYPNPFNPTTTIQFDLPESGNYSLTVYNLLGQKVATLLNGNKSAGIYSVNFDASKLASGIYIYRLSGSKVNLTRKMLLMK